MKKIILSSLLYLSSSLFASDQPIMNAWDGSFSYKTVSAYQADGGVEIGLKGSMILNPPIKFSKNDIIEIGSRGIKNLTIFVKFSNEECQVTETSVDCTSTGPTQVFIQRLMRDLGEPKTVLSDMNLDQVKVHIDENETSVEFHGARYTSNPKEDIQVFSFQNHITTIDGSSHSGNTHWGVARFPQELKDFLSRN